jgi:hypothetical protein
MSRRDRTESEPAAPAVHSPEPKSSATVTVGCKIPNGIVLQLCRPTKWIEETPSGSRDRVRYDKFGPRVFVQGPAYPTGTVPDGYGDRPQMAGGFALTTGIPKDFWDAWLEQNAESTFVVNGQVFAQPTLDRAQGTGKENAAVKSGFEPLSRDMDPKKDARLPTPISAFGTERRRQRRVGSYAGGRNGGPRLRRPDPARRTSG